MDGMAWIPGATFLMGSDRHYPEEAPAHKAAVGGFWIDAGPVTNREFGRFARKTGYVTVAERAPDPADYPGSRQELLVPFSSVFVAPRHRGQPDRSVQLVAARPGGRLASSGRTRQLHPKHSRPSGRPRRLGRRPGLRQWAGKQLPTEPAGYQRTSPVGAFPANGYGVYDMIGNVWEWTSDWYAAGHDIDVPARCGGGRAVDTRERSIDPHDQARIPRKVMKGGSHLCAPNYCRRYRPAARMAQPVDTSTSHLGFRCVVRAQPPAQDDGPA